MSNFKLFDVTQSLTNQEITQIRKILRSPFFTHREDLLLLFNALTSNKKHNQSLENLFEIVYPGKNWDYARIRNCMSDLLSRIEECLLINYYRSNPIKNQLILADIYRRRNLEKGFSSTIVKSAKSIKKSAIKNADYFDALLDYYTINMQYSSSTKRSADLFLQEVSDTQDALYLVKKLPVICAQLAHQLVRKKEYDLGLLSGVTDLIEQEQFLKIPSIAIYYYCFKFLTDPNQLEYFEKFLSLLENYRDQFDIAELEAPYRLAINFCIRKSNEGVESFRRTSWELYKEGISSKILLENDYIPRFTFNNTIAAALRLNELQWIESFIKENAHLLDEEFREATINFNLARLEYARNNFDQALLHIQKAETKDVMNNMISKILLTKIYMEIGAIDTFVSHLDSFEQFIRRNKVSQYHLKNILSLVKYCRRIIVLPSFEKSKKDRLKQAIIDEPILSERSWLLSKINS